MSADLWMGIAIGSVSPWILMLAILRSRGKQDAGVKLASERGAELLAERNKIGRLQVSVLQEIQHRLEGMFDRMPEPEPTTLAWITRRVYKDSEEGKSLSESRFPRDRSTVVGSFFPFDGHNWRYSFTSFDDKGEYDQIERPNEGESSEVSSLHSAAADLLVAARKGDSLGNDGPWLLRYAAGLIEKMAGSPLPTCRELREKAQAEEDAIIKGMGHLNEGKEGA